MVSETFRNRTLPFSGAFLLLLLGTWQPSIGQQTVEARLQRIEAKLDTLVTGALLGGGSEGIHKILDAVLSFIDKYRSKARKEII